MQHFWCFKLNARVLHPVQMPFGQAMNRGGVPGNVSIDTVVFSCAKRSFTPSCVRIDLICKYNRWMLGFLIARSPWHQLGSKWVACLAVAPVQRGVAAAPPYFA